jgi:hypothetical protein
MQTILKWVNKLFGLPFLRELNGHKEVLACILILFAALDTALLDMIKLLPEVPVLAQLQSVLNDVVGILARLGEVIGLPALAVGALHRRAKEKA